MLKKIGLILLFVLLSCYQCEGIDYNSNINLTDNQNNLYDIPDNIETRWATAENPKGEKGVGGSANAGRKGSAFIVLAAGENRTLAEVTGSSGMIRRIVDDNYVSYPRNATRHEA